MTLYYYRALDQQGRFSKGLLDAASELDLELILKRSGLDLVAARPDSGKTHLLRRNIRRSELITFFFNLEQLSRAGVPLPESLSDLRNSMDDAHFREIIASLLEAIEGGNKLSQAMAQHPEAFDRISVSLAHAGEESGQMPEIFRRITDALKWQDEMSAQLRTVMLYPAFVAIVVLAITLFLSIYLVPQLAGFIKGMGQQLPQQTKLLLALSAFFQRYWYLLPLLPAALPLAFRLTVAASPEMRCRFDRLKLELWLLGPLLRKIVLARFASTFALMYGAGIGILDCLAHARDVAGNRAVAASLDEVRHEVEAGASLTQGFQRTGMFPPLVIRMLRVGETTGSLDQALLNVSYFCERDVNSSIRRMQVMIEPVLTIALGALLGWVMLAVLAPIYDIIARVRF